VKKDTRPTPELGAYDIADFCQAHGISKSLYYRLRSEGKGPVETRIAPGKAIITRESAAAWRERMEHGSSELTATATSTLSSIQAGSLSIEQRRLDFLVLSRDPSLSEGDREAARAEADRLRRALDMAAELATPND